MTITFRPGEEMDWIEAETFFIKSYPAGRVCDHDGCDTVLSKYNPEPYCAAHEPEPDWVYDGLSFGFCEDCGEVIRIRKDRVSTVCTDCWHKRGIKQSGEPPKGKDVRTCHKCGNLRDVADFGRPSRPKSSRWNVCKFCERKRKNDLYYLKKHGMTRDEYKGLTP